MSIPLADYIERTGGTAPRPTIIEPPYLPGPVCGASDVAALLKVSPRHVQKLAADGRIPGARRLGDKLWAFNSALVFDWLGVTVDPDELDGVIFDGLSWPVCTPDEVAALLHTSIKTVQNLAKSGELPGAVRVGSLWRFGTRKLLAHVGYDV